MGSINLKDWLGNDQSIGVTKPDAERTAKRRGAPSRSQHCSSASLQPSGVVTTRTPRLIQRPPRRLTPRRPTAVVRAASCSSERREGKLSGKSKPTSTW
jgi:hypothetical protein